MKTKNFYQILIAGLIIFGTASSLSAQQTWQLSQYLLNDYIINPATAGQRDMLDVNASFRQQWAGTKYAPRTFYISANGRAFGGKRKTANTLLTSRNEQTNHSRKLYHGLGGIVLRDEFGAFAQTFIAASYAVHVPLTRKWTLSGALKGSIKNVMFDATKVETQLAGDIIYDYFATQGISTLNTWEPGVDFGVYAHSDFLFAGYSSEQLIEGNLKWDVPGINPSLARTHVGMAGGRIPLSRDLHLVPSVISKFSNDYPLTMDFNLKLDMQDRYFLAAGYRLESALVFAGGIFINDQLKVGYSYDHPLTLLNTVSNGSHEVFIGLELFKKPRLANSK